MVSLFCVILILVFFYLMVREDKAANINAKKLGACFEPSKSWRVTWKHGVLFILVLSSSLIPSGLSFFEFSTEIIEEGWRLHSVVSAIMTTCIYYAFIRRKAAVQFLKIYLEQHQDLDKAIEFANKVCLDGDYFRMVLAKNNKSHLEVGCHAK